MRVLLRYGLAALLTMLALVISRRADACSPTPCWEQLTVTGTPSVFTGDATVVLWGGNNYITAMIDPAATEDSPPANSSEYADLLVINGASGSSYLHLWKLSYSATLGTWSWAEDSPGSSIQREGILGVGGSSASLLGTSWQYNQGMGSGDLWLGTGTTTITTTSPYDNIDFAIQITGSYDNGAVIATNALESCDTTGDPQGFCAYKYTGSSWGSWHEPYGVKEVAQDVIWSSGDCGCTPAYGSQENPLYAVDDNGSLYFIYDSGQTWEEANYDICDTSTPFLAAQVVSRAGVIYGIEHQTDNAPGDVYLLDDFGACWEEVAPPPTGTSQWALSLTATIEEFTSAPLAPPTLWVTDKSGNIYYLDNP